MTSTIGQTAKHTVRRGQIAAADVGQTAWQVGQACLHVSGCSFSHPRFSRKSRIWPRTGDQEALKHRLAERWSNQGQTSFCSLIRGASGTQ